ncbi:MAG: hypothetical protein ACTHNY_07100 [Solirubrobacterales bacterium]
MFPLAAAETWWAVLGGLIPILGLGLIGFVIWRAVRGGEEEE